MPLRASDNFQFMRRLVTYICITLLALLVSGWGSMLAAAFCPHARTIQPQAVAGSHSDCHAKTEKAAAHHSGSHQEAINGANMMPRPAPERNDGLRVALSQPAGTCTHCVGRSELPATAARVCAPSLQQRDDGRIVEQTATPLSLPRIFYTQFTPTQHAPPGFAGRKHLLLNVFLI